MTAAWISRRSNVQKAVFLISTSFVLKTGIIFPWGLAWQRWLNMLTSLLPYWKQNKKYSILQIDVILSKNKSVLLISKWFGSHLSANPTFPRGPVLLKKHAQLNFYLIENKTKIFHFSNRCFYVSLSIEIQGKYGRIALIGKEMLSMYENIRKGFKYSVTWYLPSFQAH